MDSKLDDADVTAFRDWVRESMSHAGDCAYLCGSIGSRCDCPRNIADRLAAEWQERGEVRDQLSMALHVRDTQLAAANERIAEAKRFLHVRCMACGNPIFMDGKCGCADNRVHPVALIEQDLVSKLRAEGDALRQQLAEREAEIVTLRTVMNMHKLRELT